LVIRCVTDDVGGALIRIFRNSTRVESEFNIQLSGQTASFTSKEPISKDLHLARYDCDDADGSLSGQVLQVLFSPEVNVPADDYDVMRGGTISIPYLIMEGNPSAINISLWQNNTQVLVPINGTHIHFVDVYFNWTGVYTIQVSNDVGADTDSFSLRVTSKKCL
jgi:hypothetical protein